jgi:hypothetical protein
MQKECHDGQRAPDKQIRRPAAVPITTYNAKSSRPHIQGFLRIPSSNTKNTAPHLLSEPGHGHPPTRTGTPNPHTTKIRSRLSDRHHGGALAHSIFLRCKLTANCVPGATPNPLQKHAPVHYTSRSLNPSSMGYGQIEQKKIK